MINDPEFRMPRTIRRQLSATALRNINRFADNLDRSGANSCSTIRGANNDEVRGELGSRMSSRQRAA